MTAQLATRPGIYIDCMTDSASQEVDLDLRLVGYFVAVADHRHFGRAATQLRVAQPSLSRQIRRLEQQIGVRLFDRTPQRTRLTEAGEVFLPRAKALLRSAAQATAQARCAAQPSRIAIGYTTCMIITPAVRALRREHPDADVQTVHLDWNQPRDALLDHRVDAVVCALPFSTDQLARHDPLRRAPGGALAPRPSPRGQAIGHHRRHRRRTHTEIPSLRPGLECLLAHRSSARRAQGTRRSTLRNPRGWVRTRRRRAGGCHHDRDFTSACDPTSPPSPWKASNPAISSWRAAPGTAAAWWRPFANSPQDTSPPQSAPSAASDRNQCSYQVAVPA